MFIRYDQMTDIYNNINNLIKNMVETIDESDAIVKKLNDKNYWEGKGYKHYAELYGNLCINFNAFCDYIYTINTSIKDSIARYKEADAAVAKSSSGR